MNRAFAKLVKDLDFPVTKWKGNLAEDYLSYTLNMLDALNSISSSISHLGISRLSLSHTISLIPNSPSSALQHLKPIVPREIEGGNCDENNVGSSNCDEETIIQEAMVKMKGVDLLILKVLLSGLCGGNGNLGLLSLGESNIDLCFGERLMIKEIEEVNEAVKEVEEGLVVGKKSSKNGAAEKLKRKLGQLEDLLDMVSKEVDCLFSEVMARRNKLIDCLRLPKSSIPK